jgi:hypothetical protein
VLQPESREEEQQRREERVRGAGGGSIICRMPELAHPWVVERHFGPLAPAPSLAEPPSEATGLGASSAAGIASLESVR